MEKNDLETNAMNTLLAIRDNLLKPMTTEIKCSVNSTKEQISEQLNASVKLNKESFETVVLLITSLSQSVDKINESRDTNDNITDLAKILDKKYTRLLVLSIINLILALILLIF